MFHERFEEAQLQRIPPTGSDTVGWPRTQGGCEIPQGWEMGASARSVSGAASQKHMAIALGDSACSLSSLGLLDLHYMASVFEVPIACRPSDVNGKPALMPSCMCSRGKGRDTKKYKTLIFSPQCSAPFQPHAFSCRNVHCL